ncbi:hypothetical protein BD309DRAFT_946278 [Dichomitus squalens]|uniref:Uncharacterized protein n=1 Tax=Dichomitus squalens TaxID=114155 RepID=A0A4V2K918_9APHY|nr:hypothetical protein BD311DRAFT_746167 [Dichomitus squalens]TBU50045.1 hypothetical protein BD309DRAFT_946278 [Dichomitus squalens]TBU62118.1 hypothetical protein BD310DRAFT_919639 [Dichomitus squalens]
MSRRAVPFLVAGITGVLSGVYIFKPLFDQHNNSLQDTGRDGPAGAVPAMDTGRPVNVVTTKGNTSTDAADSGGTAKADVSIKHT